MLVSGAATRAIYARLNPSSRTGTMPARHGLRMR